MKNKLNLKQANEINYKNWRRNQQKLKKEDTRKMNKSKSAYLKRLKKLIRL